MNKILTLLIIASLFSFLSALQCNVHSRVICSANNIGSCRCTSYNNSPGGVYISLACDKNKPVCTGSGSNFNCFCA